MPKVKFGSFSLEIPAEWTLSTIILAGPLSEEIPSDPRMPTRTSRPFQSNIVLTLEKVAEDTTPKIYVDKQISGLIQAGVSREEVAFEEVKLVSNIDGILTEQIIEGGGGEEVCQLQLVVITGGIAYTVIASQLVGEPFEKMRDRFREILLSFESLDY